jgi:hypothetical protein
MQRLVAIDLAQASFFEALKHNPRKKYQVKSKQPAFKTNQPPEGAAKGGVVVPNGIGLGHVFNDFQAPALRAPGHPLHLAQQLHGLYGRD